MNRTWKILRTRVTQLFFPIILTQHEIKTRIKGNNNMTWRNNNCSNKYMSNWQSNQNFKNQTSSISHLLSNGRRCLFFCPLNGILEGSLWGKKVKKEDRSWIKINSIKYPNLRLNQLKRLKQYFGKKKITDKGIWQSNWKMSNFSCYQRSLQIANSRSLLFLCLCPLQT